MVSSRIMRSYCDINRISHTQYTPRNKKGFSIENPSSFAYHTPLLFAYLNPLLPYFQGILREMHTLFGLEVGLSHQRQLYILWVALWEVSLNKRVAYAIHGPTIMSRDVPQKSDVASKACPP